MIPSTSTNDRSVVPAGVSVVTYLRRPLQAGAFWAAVLLPFLTLGLLASGVESTYEQLALVGLLAANVVALLVGHGYRR